MGTSKTFILDFVFIINLERTKVKSRTRKAPLSSGVDPVKVTISTPKNAAIT